MTIDIDNFPIPESNANLTVSRNANSITLSPRTQHGTPVQLQSNSQRKLVGSFFKLFGWGISAMKAFGALFIVLWFWILVGMDATVQTKVLTGAFGVVFMTVWFAILTFIGKSLSVPKKMLALASPDWQLELTRDLWHVKKRLNDTIQEKAYDATSLSNIRFMESHVVADEFDYDTGQWIQVQLAGPLDATTGQWLVSQLS